MQLVTEYLVVVSLDFLRDSLDVLVDLQQILGLATLELQGLVVVLVLAVTAGSVLILLLGYGLCLGSRPLLVVHVVLFPSESLLLPP